MTRQPGPHSGMTGSGTTTRGEERASRTRRASMSRASRSKSNSLGMTVRISCTAGMTSKGRCPSRKRAMRPMLRRSAPISACTSWCCTLMTTSGPCAQEEPSRLWSSGDRRAACTCAMEADARGIVSTHSNHRATRDPGLAKGRTPPPASRLVAVPSPPPLPARHRRLPRPPSGLRRGRGRVCARSASTALAVADTVNAGAERSGAAADVLRASSCCWCSSSSSSSAT
mmetsp:Transcript_23641/g.60399  ORF Transcript_23641/g.60399 Transcript_23641/m.60399 type:complete len:228 (-) Transcript_23641:1070-1753(-)